MAEGSDLEKQNVRMSEKVKEIEDVNKFVEEQLKAKDELVKEAEKAVEVVRQTYSVQLECE